MSDSKQLLQDLNQYKNSLEEHSNSLKAEFQKLERRWKSFNLASESDYINQFRAGWLKTCNQFQNYINQSNKILALLDERIQALRELNKAEAEAYVGYVNFTGGIESSTNLYSEIGGDKKICGDSTKLRINLGNVVENKIPTTDIFYPDGEYQAHHVIPGASANKSPLVRAAIEKAEFEIDSAVNGIYLPMNYRQKSLIKEKTGIALPTHSGYHSIYNNLIDDILAQHWTEINGINEDTAFFMNSNAPEENQKLLNTLYGAIQIIKGLIVDGALDREDMYKNPLNYIGE